MLPIFIWINFAIDKCIINKLNAYEVYIKEKLTFETFFDEVSVCM